jgi:hypothetical protein
MEAVLSPKGGSFVTGIIHILAECPIAAVTPGKTEPVVVHESARQRALTALAKTKSGNS